MRQFCIDLLVATLIFRSIYITVYPFVRHHRLIPYHNKPNQQRKLCDIEMRLEHMEASLDNITRISLITLNNVIDLDARVMQLITQGDPNTTPEGPRTVPSEPQQPEDGPGV